MADDIPLSTAPDTDYCPEAFPKPKKINNTDDVPVALHFPTINVEHSLEDLLTNSTTSSAATLTMARPSSDVPGLDESWASLDVSDFSQEDELQSVNADSESLVDLSSIHDTDSVADEDARSEKSAEAVEEDQAASMVTIDPPNNDEHNPIEQKESPQQEDVETTIVLQKAEIQSSADAIDLEGNAAQLFVNGKILMTVSKSSLRVHGRPFNIAYYGCGDIHDSKDDLLGKVGAALVAHPSSASSSTYSVVPTEFGPSTRPSFAGLVPSQAQMIIDEVKNGAPEETSSENIKIKVNSELELVSQLHEPFSLRSNATYVPDLLVVHIGSETHHKTTDILRVIELAKRHHWPFICVVDHANDLELYPHLSLQDLRVTYCVVHGHREFWDQQPIELDIFMSLETDQLNRHFQHLIEKATSQRTWTSLIRYPVNLYQDIKQTVFANDAVHRYDLITASTASSTTKKIKHESAPSLLDVAKHYLTQIDIRTLAQQFLLSIAIVLLGSYVLAAFQPLFTEPLTIETANATSMSCVSSSPSTTATASASSVPPSSIKQVSVSASATTSSSSSTDIATKIPRIEQDMIIYDPIRFDQLWERLTGGPLAHPVPAPPQSEPATDIEPARTTASAQSAKTNSTSKAWTAMIGDELWRIKQRVKAKKEMRGQIKEMHQKLAHFGSDISDNLHGMNEHTQVYLNDLVHRSQKHLRRAHFAGIQGLSDILVEQKKILGKAQHQAQMLAKEMQIPEQQATDEVRQKLKRFIESWVGT